MRASDLAATLQMLTATDCGECFGGGVVSENHGGGNYETLGCPACFATGVTPSTDRWRVFVESAPAIATALERGAAAERALKELRDLAGDLVGDLQAGDPDSVAALAAYDALVTVTP